MPRGAVRRSPILDHVARVTRLLLVILGLSPTVACTGSSHPDPEPPKAGSASSSATPGSGAQTNAPTRSERIEALGRQSHPDVDEIIALAGGPQAWARGGKGSVLFTYEVEVFEHGRPTDRLVAAWRLYNERGQVVRQAAVTNSESGVVSAYRVFGHPHGFVVADPWIHVDLRGRVTPLTWKNHKRAGFGDVLLEDGSWYLVYSPRDKTIGQERPSCWPYTRDAANRIWCTNGDGSVLSWSDDGRTWTSRELSRPYNDGAVDGAARPAVSGSVVVVAFETADISFDRGLTWQVIDLRDVFARMHQGGKMTSTTFFDRGRLLLGSWVGSFWLAEDQSNTTFRKVERPRHAWVLGAWHGVFLAEPDSNDKAGATELLVSYDEGQSWHPIHEPTLVERVQ